MKRKPGLGEIVKVKKATAAFFGIDPGGRTGPVVDSVYSHADVVDVELYTKSGFPYTIAIHLKEIKHVR